MCWVGWLLVVVFEGALFEWSPDVLVVMMYLLVADVIGDGGNIVFSDADDAITALPFEQWALVSFACVVIPFDGGA